MADKQATDKRISRKVDKKARGHQDGANNTDPLELLLEKGKETKTLTQSDVLAVLPDGGLDLEATEELIAKLVEHGIEVQEDEDSDTTSLADVDEPDDAALREVEEELEEEPVEENIFSIGSLKYF